MTFIQLEYDSIVDDLSSKHIARQQHDHEVGQYILLPPYQK